VSNSYLGILIGGGLLVGILVFVGIYVDTSRRGLSSGKRLLLAIGFATSCFGGFLVPYAYGDQLGYIYFRILKPRAITISPYEWVTVGVVTGLLISVIIGSLYFAGIRYTASQPA